MTWQELVNSGDFDYAYCRSCGHPADMHHPNKECYGLDCACWGTSGPWKVMKAEAFVDKLLSEGVFDQGILKAVFTAGGPGSGKTTTASYLFDVPKNLNFSAFGLKMVNSDIAAVYIRNKAGFGLNFNTQPTNKDDRARGSAIRDRQFELYKNGRLGVIIDGTAANAAELAGIKSQLEQIGYDTMMVFINTDLETAMRRNKERGARGGREVLYSVVEERWHAAQANMTMLRGLFGSNFMVVDNSTDGSQVSAQCYSAARSFVTSEVQNPVGKEWIRNMLALRSGT